jgi:8-oxo-dGTP pyrophosphatase MutT (NUDIX family)
MHDRPQPPRDELVDLYDPADPVGRVTGTAPRSLVRAQNLPHAATSVAVRDHDGRIYVHRRTDTKDVFPGAHDVWAGGVVGAGEDPTEAAQRELAEELGLTRAPLRPLFVTWYADDHTTYLAHVFETTYDEERDGPIRHQPEEVADGWWMTLAELDVKLADPSWPFVPDGRYCLNLYLSLDRSEHA